MNDNMSPLFVVFLFLFLLFFVKKFTERGNRGFDRFSHQIILKNKQKSN